MSNSTEGTPTPSPLAGADLSNWRTAPFSQWAFHHVQELMPCAEIARGAGDVLALPSRPASFAEFRVAGGDGVSLDLAQFERATDTDALVILHDGRIVHESYAHGMTGDSPHILMSISKSLVGLIAGILQHDGVLDLAAPVSSLVPEVAQGAYRGATLRQLLDMRTGIVLDADAQRAYNQAAGWEPLADGADSADLRSFFAGLQPGGVPHNGPLRYVSANTDLLGWALERATGKSFATLVSELLWQPCGAEANACVTLDRRGQARSTGGVCASARDLARIGQLVLDRGSRDGRRIVPAAWIDDLSDHGDHRAWRDGEWAQLLSYDSMAYRSGWYAIDDAPRTLFGMGIHGQNLFVDRVNHIVVAKLSSQHQPIDVPAWRLTHRALPAIRRCLLG